MRSPQTRHASSVKTVFLGRAALVDLEGAVGYSRWRNRPRGRNYYEPLSRRALTGGDAAEPAPPSVSEAMQRYSRRSVHARIGL